MLSPLASRCTKFINCRLEEQKFPVEIKDIQKSIVYKDNLIILSSQSGLFIFKIKK